ncbi:MAG TPA: ABC transporter substrate-binding protein [Alphaproteobacteria bacterium]|nr:ABC transporter substrate-binding protein [Alphaproteobacteria bacterium]
MPTDRSDGIRRRTVLATGAAIAAASVVPAWLVRPAHAATGTLRAGITGYNVINTLDPGKHSLIPEAYVVWALFNALLKFNKKMEVVPDLAESFAAKDRTTLEFKLRKGVRFHDGSEMTADDVKFTIERLQNETYASPNKGKVSEVTEVKVVDPYTVEIITKQAFAPLLAFLTNARTGTQIVPRKAVEAMGDEAFGRQPVGTGAYKIKDWKANESVTLVAHDDYFVKGQPSMATVEIPLIAEESSGVTALKGGQIDLTSTAPFADVPTLEQDKTLKVLKQPGMNCRFIALNHRKPPFDDVHFRRAVSMAFDRNAMVKVVLFGEGVPSHGLIPPSLAYAYETKPRETALFNAERAKAELAKSKYANGFGDIPVLAWGSSWWKRTVEVLALQVNETLGTKLAVEVTEANTVYARQKSGDFLASVWGWLGPVDADEYVGEILSTKGWRNFQGYSNPKLDELVEQGRTELDLKKRGDIYKQAENIAIEEAAVLPCFCSNIHNLMTTQVQGFTQLPYSNFGDQFAAIKMA